MSLVCWLPLNGNSNNQGTLGLTPTIQGTLSSVNGKLGAGYKFDDGTQTGNGISLNTNFLDVLGTTYSIAVWVNPYGNHVHYNGTVLSSGNWNNQCWAFGLSQDNSKVDLFVNRYNTYATCSVPTNTWTHLACTFENGTVKLYKNGEWVFTGTGYTAVSQSDASNTCIGRETYANGYFGFNGSIQDLRVYNHTLSAREIKEIGKGLCLHYKLDNRGCGNPNLITSTYNRPTPEKSRNEYAILADSYAIFEEYGLVPYTISFDMKSDIAGNFSLYATSGSEPKYVFDTITISVGTEYKHFVYSFTPRIGTSTGTWSRITVYGSYGTGKIPTIKNVKLELGSKETPWCPHTSDALYTTLGLNSGTESDGSGLGYNGSQTDLSFSSDTPRYNASTVFNGTTSAISFTSASFQTVFENQYTMSFWIKGSGEAGDRSIYFGTDNYSVNIEKTTGNYLRYYWGGSPDYTNSSFPIPDDEWIHVVIVRSSPTDTKFYKNGVLVNTYTTTCAARTVANHTFYVGRDARTSTTPFTGNMSDFRIYATALSASDVYDLYSKTASIDKAGNLHCYELVEE